MTLAAGSRLGPYEVLSPLGAGGMGEVYKARDTRLERTVAVKVLPQHLSSSPEVRQRFEREAKTISQLSHPHICALYDVGNQDGIEYLVMEYLEGDTLADRLSKGPLPLEQTLRFGMEIADALDRAHRQGIVHRDLKPGNIMITRSGVKLLDYGLAKALAPPSPASNLTALPTETPLTEQGAILGTLQYMAPEQLEGKEADARADIFAFGAVLYEMATGKKAFSGKSHASLIGAILRDEPSSISSVQPMTPPALDRIVKTCLAKEPEDRWQSARDVALQIRDVSAVEGGIPTAQRRNRGIGILIGALILAVGGLAALLLSSRRPSVESEPVSFSISLPTTGPFAVNLTQNPFSVSPDGRSLAFVAPDTSGQVVLWLRPMQALSARSLPDTDGAASPFWSPDSRWIGFFAKGKLEKVEAAGGTPLTICDAPGVAQSGTWGTRGDILFAQLIDTVVRRVSAAGGAQTPILKADPGRHEWSICWPSFLPDSRHFLYVGRSLGAKQTYVRLGDIETGKSAELLSDSSRAEYAPTNPQTAAGPSKSGFLLSVRDGNLLAQPFDAAGLRLTGEARNVVAEVWQHAFTGVGGFSVSRNGFLAYRSSDGPAQLTWLDRQGHAAGTEGSQGAYSNVRLSPDGRTLAVSTSDSRTGTHGLWLAETGSGILTRFTLGAGDDWLPVWSPDGRNLAFSRGQLQAPPHLYEASIDGGEPHELTGSGARDPKTGRVRGVQWVQDWSPDGRFICYSEFSPDGRGDIWILDLAHQRESTEFLATPSDEIEPQFSPDGRWIAFSSDESGSYEIYVTPFPGPGKKLRVSNSGGMRPRWRRDGGELFYVSGDGRMTSVPVRLGASPFFGAPQSLFSFDSAGWRDYDVAADGKRFLVVVNVGGPRSAFITITTNWLAMLRENR